jgi:hypothetical protein
VDDYRRILNLVASRLDEAKVPYMVSGSTALGFYGRPRMTRDVDIVIELDAEGIARLEGLFSGDFMVDVEAMEDAVRRRSLFNFVHYETVVKVDFIVRKNAPYRRAEFARRRAFNQDQQVIWVVAPEDLVLSKLHWARESRSEMQLGDVRNLLGLVMELDEDYLEHWASELGVTELLAEVRTT